MTHLYREIECEKVTAMALVHFIYGADFQVGSRVTFVEVEGSTGETLLSRPAVILKVNAKSWRVRVEPVGFEHRVLTALPSEEALKEYIATHYLGATLTQLLDKEEV